MFEIPRIPDEICELISMMHAVVVYKCNSWWILHEDGALVNLMSVIDGQIDIDVNMPSLSDFQMAELLESH